MKFLKRLLAALRSSWSTDYDGPRWANTASYGVWKEGRFFDA